MTKKLPKILAIDPGTRNMGIAFMDNGQLIYQAVKTIDKHKSPHDTLKEGRKIIYRLINDFKPQVLVFEKAFFKNNKTAALLNVFADEIQVIGKRKRLKVVGYAPRQLKKLFCGNGRASKQEVAWVVISKYPELNVYLPQEKKWKERYWCNLFDAVALAIVASSNINGGARNQKTK